MKLYYEVDMKTKSLSSKTDLTGYSMDWCIPFDSGKKVNFEEGQLWEKEEKSACRSGRKKRGKKREGARPLSRRFQVWDVNFFNHMFFFCFSFRYTAFFVSFRFLYYQEEGSVGPIFLWVTFITPVGCCHFPICLCLPIF